MYRLQHCNNFCNYWLEAYKRSEKARFYNHFKLLYRQAPLNNGILKLVNYYLLLI